MATRLYARTDTPSITPTPKGVWTNDVTPPPVYARLGEEKEGVQTAATFGSNTGAGGRLNLVLVSDPILVPQTVTGTFDFVFKAQEASALNNMRFRIHAYVTQGDSTSLVRGTLVDKYSESVSATNEFPTVAAGQNLDTPQAMTAVGIQAGDRVVVEVGYVSGQTGQNGTVYYGGTGPDLTDGDTSATGAGWVEFSGGLALRQAAVRAWLME